MKNLNHFRPATIAFFFLVLILVSGCSKDIPNPLNDDPKKVRYESFESLIEQIRKNGKTATATPPAEIVNFNIDLKIDEVLYKNITVQYQNVGEFELDKLRFKVSTEKYFEFYLSGRFTAESKNYKASTLKFTLNGKTYEEKLQQLYPAEKQFGYTIEIVKWN